MPGLLADANIEGHLEAILRICTSDEWCLLWQAANVQVLSFQALQVEPDVSDRELWRLCQAREIVLLTGNRNSESADALEPTIRAESRPESLPVLTLSDPDRLIRDRAYLERVAVRLIDIMLELESVRGTGRLYLP